MSTSAAAVADEGGAASRSAKLSTALAHKADANAAFLSGDIPAALKSYHLAVLYLSGLESRSILGLMGENSGRDGKPDDLSSDSEDETAPNPEEDITSQAAKELSLVYSNMAACYLKQTLYSKAIGAAEKAVKNDSSNVKAKFRKAQALRLSGDVYKAQTFLKETIEAIKAKEKGKGKGKDVVGEFERELSIVEKTIKEKENKARNVWKGFLNKPK